MRKVAYSIIGLMMGLPLVASAQDKVFTLPNPTNIKDVPGLIDAITTFIVQLASPVFVIMMLVGAFQMLTAAGNETKFTQGKKTITYTIIGMAIVLSAKGITAVIKNFLGAK
jgi:hypothetical protein